MNTIVIDFESKRMSDGTGIIFSISWMPVTFEASKGWKSKGRGRDPVYESSSRVTHELVNTIFIEEALSDPCIGQDPDIIKKVGATVVETLTSHGVVTTQPFAEAMKHLLHVSKGLTWLGHSIDRDIQFMVQTDRRFDTKIFKKDPMSYPETCCRFSDWSSVAKVCTQQLLTRRCPRFYEKYVKAGGSSARLVDLVSYVNGSTQHHTSAQDVLDLAAVLQRAFEEDRFQLEPGKSYMTCIPLRTAAV